MCVAVVKPEDAVLTREVAENCWKANSDGAGFMFVEDGRLRVFKGYMSFKKFWRQFDGHMQRLNNPKSVIHFRIKTHGKVDFSNCHPHRVNNDMALVHNGVLSHVKIKDTNYSDTVHFTNMLRELPQDFLDRNTYLEMISYYIGTSSKVVFMDAANRIKIINESSGTWDTTGVNPTKCWFSNYSFRGWSSRSTNSSSGGWVSTSPSTKTEEKKVIPFAKPAATLPGVVTDGGIITPNGVILPPIVSQSETTSVPNPCPIKRTFMYNDKNGDVVEVVKPAKFGVPFDDDYYRDLENDMNDAAYEKWAEAMEADKLARQEGVARAASIAEAEELAKSEKKEEPVDTCCSGSDDEEYGADEDDFVADVLCEYCDNVLTLPTEYQVGHCIGCANDILNEMEKEEAVVLQ